jgi:hypothetical protein
VAGKGNEIMAEDFDIRDCERHGHLGPIACENVSGLQHWTCRHCERSLDYEDAMAAITAYRKDLRPSSADKIIILRAYAKDGGMAALRLVGSANWEPYDNNDRDKMPTYQPRGFYEVIYFNNADQSGLEQRGSMTIIYDPKNPRITYSRAEFPPPRPMVVHHVINSRDYRQHFVDVMADDKGRLMLRGSWMMDMDGDVRDTAMDVYALPGKRMRIRLEARSQVDTPVILSIERLE